jgi:hypothetical protein
MSVTATHLLSLNSIYLQFIISDVFQTRGAFLSGFMFGSALQLKIYRPRKCKMPQVSPVVQLNIKQT